jgi:PIN domain nuclease of toxin-antitoxin system
VVSVWEILLKHAQGRLSLPSSPAQFFPEARELLRLESLVLDEPAALFAATLPPLHRNPFDRMLICQAIAHGLTLLTPDNNIRRYPVKTLW